MPGAAVMFPAADEAVVFGELSKQAQIGSKSKAPK